MVFIKEKLKTVLHQQVLHKTELNYGKYKYILFEWFYHAFVETDYFVFSHDCFQNRDFGDYYDNAEGKDAHLFLFPKAKKMCIRDRCYD